MDSRVRQAAEVAAMRPGGIAPSRSSPSLESATSFVLRGTSTCHITKSVLFPSLAREASDEGVRAVRLCGFLCAHDDKNVSRYTLVHRKELLSRLVDKPLLPVSTSHLLERAHLQTRWTEAELVAVAA